MLSYRRIFTARWMDPSLRHLQRTLVILVLKHKYCASDLSPPLQGHPNLSSLFQRNVRAHASPGPSKWSVKSCDQSGMPCVGSSLSISSLFTEPRFPEAAFSGSFCIDPPHAGLSLRVVTGSDVFFLSTGRTWLTLGSRCRSRAAAGRWFQSWHDERYEVVRCRHNYILIFGQTWCFTVFHPYEYRFSEQAFQAIGPVAFLRVLAPWRTGQGLDVNLRLLVCLHFTVRGHHRVRVSGSSQSIQFIWA